MQSEAFFKRAGIYPRVDGQGHIGWLLKAKDMEVKASMKGLPKCKQQNYQPETEGAQNFPNLFQSNKTQI